MPDETTPIRLYVTEQFVSVQGEGTLTGVPSTFVRLGGCNLRCSWCDTPYSSWKPEGEHVDLDVLVDQIAGEAPRHVVLTGGEPMLQAGAVPLTRALSARGFHITVETAGTVDAPLHIDLASLSPKMSDSAPPSVNFDVYDRPVIVVVPPVEENDKTTTVKLVADPELNGQACLDILVNKPNMSVKELKKHLRKELGKLSFKKLEAQVDWDTVRSKQITFLHRGS